jgi:hypothetical protein
MFDRTQRCHEYAILRDVSLVAPTVCDESLISLLQVCEI